MANLGDYALTMLESTPAFNLGLALSAMLAVIFYVAKLGDAYTDFKKFPPETDQPLAEINT